MHIHILGICGTFMGGIAQLARTAGHKVTGCDANVYPPMSTQLEAAGIHLIEGYAPDQINLRADIYLIGNVVSRGNPLMEAILNAGLPYVSGPQWLAEHVLRDPAFPKWVLAVAGTHGKTTTTSMLAWILEYAGLAPGFLVGGVPENFGVSARAPGEPRQEKGGRSPFFVIEADEYDTAFFDKRSKFVHYHPRTAILNNLEFDHADIFNDLAAIETQFHHLVRTVPSQGKLIVNGREASLQRVLTRGCWSEVEHFGAADSASGWQIGSAYDDGFEVLLNGHSQGRLQWALFGEHNQLNALAALAAARHVGVSTEIGIAALGEFKNVKRRMEVCGIARGVTIYDDFAHHPTAIATTIAGLRGKMNNAGRILAVLEPRSNTMKLGTMKAALADSLREADKVFCYAGQLNWNPAEALIPLGERAQTMMDMGQIVAAIVAEARQGDQILVMSNGGFGGIHQQLLDALNA
ncbi:UDP-N-acetylmuramate:L-alanyl-gamma-D-glutamyl-meso-diaminopimelate ligase [Chitinimonas sp. BJB300]|uniref:UDP-N-acetylmuramate:L-alanyl-gamma-D-glutamyl- meso-diaminopimelate ligase n=1 Tax=Chitinimonas sp. BJB300 TaxID=1559339 RepID=UPI000C0C7197|nr:UDP-N-acetylmuramate:L-alanyl-gamma-D-glutamyl-meso-diaminopimelate ligase [Chitinimonas sp. BJB300]PHV10689.1 UDP-N-acetylmuramate:L-alanyl-gamma-D-glutamyl-meso-diaminopimelate ligase [Chitinimonas sp. BJB300]TSJ90769.1 UDP-N-acetylmuramate:L-alanyl-gamma-D-glutamyl-meso-diaminopimelate ligase [Chitinimonas sp. BJB300]